MPNAPTSIPTRFGRRIMSRSGGLAGERGQRMRALAARLIAGESVTPAEFDGVAPQRGPGSIAVGYDWNTGELTLDEAYINAGGGVGVMEIGGAIAYRCSAFDALFFGDIPTGLLVEALRMARNDRGIRTLLLKMDTPGGSVNGCYEIAAALDEFKQGDAEGPKTLIAVSAEYNCSLGVFISCVADRVYTTPTAITGSVGTIFLRYDDSKMFEEFGIVPHILASHPRKAQGQPGVPLEEALLDDERAMLAKHWPEFRARVAAGRSMSEEAVEALGARVYMGADAIAAGLVDEEVRTFDELLASLVRGDVPARKSVRAAGPTPDEAQDKEPTMPDVKTATLADLEKDNPALLAKAREGLVPAEKAASLADLQGAFPGDANAPFVLECMGKGLTMTAAKAAHAEKVLKDAAAQGASHAATIAAKDADLAAKAARIKELEALNGKGQGTTPVSASPGEPVAVKDLPKGSSKAAMQKQAKDEWAANAGGCRDKGGEEASYIALRVAQMEGRVTRVGK